MVLANNFRRSCSTRGWTIFRCIGPILIVSAVETIGCFGFVATQHGLDVCRSMHHASWSYPSQQYHVSLASSANDCVGNSIDGNCNDIKSSGKEYFIEHVTSKARALDVRVFQGTSVTAQEYVLKQKENGTNISEEEAVDILMENCDDDGNYLYNIPQYEPETYFVAVHNGTGTAGNTATSDSDGKGERRETFAKHRGIVGVVSAQLRRRAPLIAGPSSDDADPLPSVPLPSPHVYVANMLVDDKMRRKGVGMALLSSVLQYTKSWNEKIDDEIPIVLSVDSDNVGAIKLYEQFGFDFLERNNAFCMMALKT